RPLTTGSSRSSGTRGFAAAPQSFSGSGSTSIGEPTLPALPAEPPPPLPAVPVAPALPAAPAPSESSSLQATAPLERAAQRTRPGKDEADVKDREDKRILKSISVARIRPDY